MEADVTASGIMEVVPLFTDRKSPDGSPIPYLTFGQIADAVVAEGWATSMSRQAVEELAKDVEKWPVPKDEWETFGRGSRAPWVIPWDDRLKDYFKERAASPGRLKVPGSRAARLAAYAELEAKVGPKEAARELGLNERTARLYRELLREQQPPADGNPDDSSGLDGDAAGDR